MIIAFAERVLVTFYLLLESFFGHLVVLFMYFLAFILHLDHVEVLVKLFNHWWHEFFSGA